MTTEVPPLDESRRDAFAEQRLQALIGTLETFAIYLGDRLGYYTALAGGEPVTAAELATRTGTQERYAREWLEQQTTAEILEVIDVSAEPSERRFRLPPEHADVLANRDSLAYLAPFARLAGSVGPVLGDLVRAYRDGGGVAWGAYGDDARLGQGEANRPAFLQLLGTEWLPAIADIHQRLQQPGARVADIACGTGWSSIGIAQAYPTVQVDGFDPDAPAIAYASEAAREAGVADRVRFHARDGADPALEGQYDLVTMFEALHDLARPVEVLTTMRRLLADGGSVLIMDERVAENFGDAIGDPIERLMYGYSLLACLPNGLAESPSVGTGTVLRPSMLRAYAEQAGFRDVEVLPIENDFFRFYRLHA